MWGEAIARPHRNLKGVYDPLKLSAIFSSCFNVVTVYYKGLDNYMEASMKYVMDWVGLKTGATVTIQQFGNFRDLHYDYDTAEGIRALHYMMENRMVGGRAFVNFTCGCVYTYKCDGYLSNEDLCDAHEEIANLD